MPNAPALNAQRDQRDQRGRPGQQAWALVALGLALLSMVFFVSGAATADWAWHAEQPLRALNWWTAALVHHGPWHLAANVGAAAAVAAWGWVARLQTRHALAWLAAWPLSQALLITDPGSLSDYAGLSATLHAGVAIGCWSLMRDRVGGARFVGGAVFSAVLIKLMLEAPAVQAWWTGLSVQALPSVALPGAPGHVLAGHAHLCGVAAGLIAAAVADGLSRSARHPEVDGAEPS